MDVAKPVLGKLAILLGSSGKNVWKERLRMRMMQGLMELTAIGMVLGNPFFFPRLDMAGLKPH